MKCTLALSTAHPNPPIHHITISEKPKCHMKVTILKTINDDISVFSILSYKENILMRITNHLYGSEKWDYKLEVFFLIKKELNTSKICFMNIICIICILFINLKELFSVLSCFMLLSLLGIPEEFEHVFTFLSMSDVRWRKRRFLFSGWQNSGSSISFC